MKPGEIRTYNRGAWDREARGGKSEWCVPVTPEQIAAARRGDWSIVLTDTKPVPRTWFPPLQDRDVLCLGSGGGQQGPILAAAGARVTVLDNSPEQLARDSLVATRDALPLRVVEGDMADLGAFASESFDLVFHPISNCFVPDVRPVWREAHRVLRHGGVLLAGVMNPVAYLFDFAREEHGTLHARHAIPYADTTDMTDAEREKHVAAGWPLEFGHTLEDLLGGQLAAGFVLTALYEDRARNEPLSRLIATRLATRAVKL